VAGVDFQQYYEPRMASLLQPALQNIHALGSNWIILEPTWTFTKNNPLTFSQLPGKDPFIKDTSETVASARALNLNAMLFPQPQFSTNYQDFWSTAPRDPAWWDNWFNRYRAFAVHHADMATSSNAQALILGGEWIAPALPNGTLANGTSSGVPADAEVRWTNIVAEVRQHFTGLVLFALPYNNTDIQAPVNLLRNTDGIYLLWFAEVSTQPTPSKADMITEIGRLLDENIFPVFSAVNKPLVIALSYPASTYSATGCIPSGSGGCLYWTVLSRPNPDVNTVSIDMQQQFDIYDAMFNAINARSWVSGIVSRGFFAPVTLQDKSASVYGKSAADLLWYWYPRMLGVVK
jgi:hypothetical protein